MHGMLDPDSVEFLPGLGETHALYRYIGNLKIQKIKRSLFCTAVFISKVGDIAIFVHY